MRSKDALFLGLVVGFMIQIMFYLLKMVDGFFFIGNVLFLGFAFIILAIKGDETD